MVQLALHTKDSDADDILEGGCIKVAEAVKISSLSRSKLYNLMADGSLEYVKIGRRRGIPRNALVGLMERSLVRR